MKIYTKTGDKGETSLYGGKRVRKDNLRVEAYGAVDETNAYIGFARAAIHEGSSGSREVLNFIDSVLEPVQHKLFAIGANLAGSDDPKYSVEDSDLEFLEKSIDKMDEQVQPIKAFILPFGTDLSSRLHLARVVSRNAERRIVALSQAEAVSPNLLAYANRLSDFLFTLARFANKAEGTPDVVWRKETKEPVLPTEKQEKLLVKPAESALVQQAAASPKNGNGNGQSLKAAASS